MTLWIEGFGNSVDEAAKVVARAANISPKVQRFSIIVGAEAIRTKTQRNLRRVTKVPKASLDGQS